MKLALPLKLAAVATACLSSIIPFNPAKASIFTELEVQQSQFIAIARPYGDNKYDLLVIEQIAGKNLCWSESGSNPTVVEPLLLNFDFTGHCNRSTDSNGYSIRIAGEDYGLDYLLRIVERNGELVLVGTNRANPSAPEILVGRTHGLGYGFQKIILEPGWHFTKRTYQGKVLGHVYFSSTQVTVNSSPEAVSQDSLSQPTNTVESVSPETNAVEFTSEGSAPANSVPTSTGSDGSRTIEFSSEGATPVEAPPPLR